jgi:hypothetical protein
MEAQIKTMECKFEDLKKEGEGIAYQTPQRKPLLQSIDTKLTEVKQMVSYVDRMNRSFGKTIILHNEKEGIH